MSMTASASIILAAMVAGYAVAKILKLSTELSMLAAALVGALAGGAGVPTRHIVEGAFTYLDICLIFVTATLFMNLLKESGGVAFAVRAHPAALPPPQGRAVRDAGLPAAHPRGADRGRQRHRAHRRRHGGHHPAATWACPRPRRRPSSSSSPA